MSTLTSIDESLLEAFEGGTLPPSQFHHRDHVHVAWVLLGTAPLLEAIGRYSTGLKSFAARAGQPGLYHETITWAYLLLIQERRAKGSAEAREGFAAFAAENPDLFTWKPSVLATYYRDETLASDLARQTFLMPDRL
jgi:hypothetical protein